MQSVSHGAGPLFYTVSSLSTLPPVRLIPPDTMNKIIVYEHCNFQGLSREFTSNVSNLIDHSFNDCISSLKIIGNPWVVYRHVNFKDILAVYEEGEYSAVQHNDTISSMELVTEDLTDPQITLYEHVNYGGQKIVVNCETSLCSGSFNDLASSHKVQRGAWILYEHANRGGAFMVARASHLSQVGVEMFPLSVPTTGF
uniref:Beta/gamma crystallin 'Greek key' domain-containing protein n=1 Tax=Electrophorus electricus TaxID=8005 RepID=A0A4W4E4E4_ELEEL